MVQCGCRRIEERGRPHSRVREAHLVSQQSFRLDGAGVPLSATLFVPQGVGPHPGLVICHGMPAGPRPEPGAPPPPDDGLDYPGVAEWCALEGFATLIFNFRGTGDSEGNFHPMGWAHDLDSVISWMLARPEVDARRLALLGSRHGSCGCGIRRGAQDGGCGPGVVRGACRDAGADTARRGRGAHEGNGHHSRPGLPAVRWRSGPPRAWS